jgi:hypothetical protein
MLNWQQSMKYENVHAIYHFFHAAIMRMFSVKNINLSNEKLQKWMLIAIIGQLN